ncbi:AP-3 complex subunit mu-1 [Clonorchis sinensis]|uniref:AP-3 complex subunit mu-1 n=1 Tax=Clonorchis sinensis TaxID=79923 RepID=A0A8T1MBW4_CLOSI|nr:AP-3 complex subunit mu-1 [Clonorchis sinensis]
MIQSLFIISPSNEICLEKHWSKVTPKAVCDQFFEAVSQSTSVDEIPIVIESNKECLIHISKGRLFFVAVCVDEVPPLLVIELLLSLANVIVDYFGTVNESVIKDNLVCIYEILDEMIDGGFPLATEPNVLKDIVRPANILKTITDVVTGTNSAVSSTLPSCQLSNVRWRRGHVKYTNNEVYFDLIEQVNAIVDSSGNTVFKEVDGSIECFSKLSGVPDLTLAFSNNRLIDDASLHPCIRLLRWERERVLSFIPPDGRFCLFRYHVNCLSPLTLPVIVRHSISLREQGSRLDLVVIPKTLGRTMESVRLTMHMPSSVVNVNATPSTGRVMFDTTTRLFEWNIGRIDSKHANPTLKGSYAVSGLKIARVDIYAEKYKPFKGVKYLTSSGKFEVRT